MQDIGNHVRLPVNSLRCAGAGDIATDEASPRQRVRLVPVPLPPSCARHRYLARTKKQRAKEWGGILTSRALDFHGGSAC